MKNIKTFSHYDLSNHNTMALACVAKSVIPLADEEQIFSLMQKPCKSITFKPLFILSGGSNVVLPPKLNATVILPKFKGIHILQEDAKKVYIEVMAGENWHHLVQYTVKKGWFGLENLALIPGLVGACPIQNIGAYGVQVENVLTHVKAYHIPSQTWQVFDKSMCQFGYRNSLFKLQPNTWLITRVGFCLHKDPKRIIVNYGEVKQIAQSYANQNQHTHIQPMDVMQAIIDIRQQKLPNPKTLPNCGSFFQNPIIEHSHYIQLQNNYPNIVGYPLADGTVKVAAGWLIEQAGLKGQGIYPILTHQKQALVLTNHLPKKALQTDIDKAQRHIIQKIQNLFNITLVREPVWVNQDGTTC